jgi:hypothetical protein
MWGAIGVAAFVLTMVAVLRLDPRVAGYTAGLLVVACIFSCGAAVWLDSRAARATARLADGLRRPRAS